MCNMMSTVPYISSVIEMLISYIEIFFVTLMTFMLKDTDSPCMCVKYSIFDFKK